MYEFWIFGVFEQIVQKSVDRPNLLNRQLRPVLHGLSLLGYLFGLGGHGQIWDGWSHI